MAGKQPPDATFPNLHAGGEGEGEGEGEGDQYNYLYIHFYTAFKSTKRWAPAAVFLFFFTLLAGAFFFRIDVSVIRQNFIITIRRPIEFPLIQCSNESTPTTCKANYPATYGAYNQLWGAACPDYFRWIHEDLKPWATSGISRETLESAKRFATIRLVIINGRLYLEKYHSSFQTRDLFTLWGIVQLLRLYPGRVPDLELMFQCGDMPEIIKGDYQGPNATLPPSLFQYSGHNTAFAIIFPDWSFWGWAEVNIKPWKSMLEGIIQGSKRLKWEDRIPYAYWKGNPHVSTNREDLMTCNVSDKHDWNARLYAQDWLKETKEGYKNSNLEDQCIHRYKIYAEGRAWSVSDKYILACDSVTLLIEPNYYDFFMRSLIPMHHYWPIREKNKCKDIKFAVDWGNKHPYEAQIIGEGGSKFVQENLTMKYVYEYMLHLLKEYAKLLKFKPEISEGGVEVCSESMVCSEQGLVRQFLEETLVMSSSNELPCAMPPPYDPSALQQLFERKENITKQAVILQNSNKT